MSILLAILSCVGVISASEEPSFVTDVQDVPPGAPATLTWKWGAASKGYLSTVGLLQNPRGGTATVKADETSDYVLVLEAPGFPPRVLSRRIVVRGSKGASADWPPDPFLPLAVQNQYKVDGASLADLADKTRRTLQDTGKFEVRQFSPDVRQIVFVTAFSQRSDLGKAGESPKRVRRIAYRVALASSAAPGTIEMSISATVEWRIVIVRRWFPENPSTTDLYQDQIAALKKEILSK